MSSVTVRATPEPVPGGTRLVLVGAVAGLAWAAGLRGFMAEVAGEDSSVEWVSTFVWVLLPGTVIGALLAWAEHIRRSGGRRGWRWLALSPLLFSAVLFSHGLDFGTLAEDGVGGGAIGVPVIGMVGGYALSGRGPLWSRIVCGLLASSAIPVWVITAPDIGPGLNVASSHGAWMALYYWSFLAVLMLACSIPHRPTVPPRVQETLKRNSTTSPSAMT